MFSGTFWTFIEISRSSFCTTWLKFYHFWAKNDNENDNEFDNENGNGCHSRPQKLARYSSMCPAASSPESWSPTNKKESPPMPTLPMKYSRVPLPLLRWAPPHSSPQTMRTLAIRQTLNVTSPVYHASSPYHPNYLPLTYSHPLSALPPTTSHLFASMPSLGYLCEAFILSVRIFSVAPMDLH